MQAFEIKYWVEKHWLFNQPEIISTKINTVNDDLNACTLFHVSDFCCFLTYGMMAEVQKKSIKIQGYRLDVKASISTVALSHSYSITHLVMHRNICRPLHAEFEL